MRSEQYSSKVLFPFFDGLIPEGWTLDIAEKNWKKYDVEGDLLITITYKDNREYRINGEKIEFADKDVKLIQ